MRQAHRPGGITPRRGFLLPCCVGAVVWCTLCGVLWGVVRRSFAVGVLVYSGGVLGVLWAVCGAVGVALRRRPTFLPKKDFLTDFSKESETEPAPPAAHRRHSIHQQNPPQQARQIAPARTPPPGTVQSHQNRENTNDFITHFQANFSDFPGLVLFRRA